MNTVETIKMLRALKNHELNEQILVKENGQIYQWDGDNWVLAKTSSGIDLYTLNKNIVCGLPDLSESAIAKKQKELREFIDNHSDKYFMLLSSDRKPTYVTVFVKDNGTITMESAVTDCLHDLGKIKSIELTKDGTVFECWVTGEKKEAFVLYFFANDRGIMTCR